MEFTIRFLRVVVNDLAHAWPLLGGLLLMIVVVGFFIGRIERWTPVDALYHTFINATTVGYGDFRPTTAATRILAVLLAFLGLLFTGLIVAIALHAADDAFDRVYQGRGFSEIQGVISRRVV